MWTYGQEVPLISISRWLAEQIESRTGRKSRVVNLGIDPQVFHAIEQPAWPKHNPAIILYIARDPQAGYMLKGFYDFVRAMNHVWNTNKNIAVHMICTERDLLLPPAIPHHIYRPKTAQEMAEHYQTADLFVSTSWFEGFAIPPLEAMACGTPVVTTNSGGVLDFSEHMKSAYIVEPKNPASIANGILSVLSNPDLAATLRKGGLQSASRLTKQHFETSIVETLEDIYEERRRKRGR
ncbi:glycosyltransferase family 4 protein [Aneurinibacillus sp. BA2021]|nr:glycosyltransferase family 4 protein [Aneurinibacillus sp. BA2021]